MHQEPRDTVADEEYDDMPPLEDPQEITPAVTTPARYRNEETFLAQTPVSEIKAEKLIVLDGFAFDIDELTSHYLNSALHHHFKNPHLANMPVNQDFSIQAREKMKEYPALRQHIVALETQLASQGLLKFHFETLLQFILMLKKLKNEGVRGSQNAISVFIEHKTKLSAQEQKNLEEFIISVTSTHGEDSFQRMTFAGVITTDCIKTMQIFGWQFVVMQRPEAMVLVPAKVRVMAERTALIIGPLTDASPEQEAEFSDEDMLALESIRLFEMASIPEAVDPRELDSDNEEDDEEEVDAMVADVFVRALAGIQNPLLLLGTLELMRNQILETQRREVVSLELLLVLAQIELMIGRLRPQVIALIFATEQESNVPEATNTTPLRRFNMFARRSQSLPNIQVVREERQSAPLTPPPAGSRTAASRLGFMRTSSLADPNSDHDNSQNSSSSNENNDMSPGLK